MLLLLIYVLVTTGAQSVAGTGFLGTNSADVLSPLGTVVFGNGVLQKLLLFSVLTSASASTQTTILPTARTTISMAAWGAIPKIFGRTHVKFQTPDVSTLAMGAVSIIWTVFVVLIDPGKAGNPGNVLLDSITAVGFAICFYYGFTGFACAVYYRRELFVNAKRFFLVGVLPMLGGLLMFAVFAKAYLYYDVTKNNYSPPFDGFQVPIVIGIGGLLLGIMLMLVAWPFQKEYFKLRPETADPAVLEAHFACSK